jgi:hypothetical protein
MPKKQKPDPVEPEPEKGRIDTTGPKNRDWLHDGRGKRPKKNLPVVRIEYK